MCDDLSWCNNIKSGKKKHPKKCKKKSSNNECKFKDECAYHHKETKNQEGEDIQSKVFVLKKIITKMAIQLII